ncbi:MAG: response regulator transcription factor [Flavobacteriaceae bacterium]|nr:response regulator transcription factor [Flavobacteriaceae bacterium]
MKKEKVKIIAVDDHDFLLEGIVSALSKYKELKIIGKSTCDEAFKEIKNAAAAEEPFDILFTDLSFENTSSTDLIEDGEALIRKLDKEGIRPKTGVITGHSSINRVFNVINNLNPLAYVLKSSCSGEELYFAIQKMLNNEFFYTHSIHEKLMRRRIVEIQMDEMAIQILRELPRHSKIKNMEGVIRNSKGVLLSLRTIENKLSNLRIDLDANNNIDLFMIAKELGIVD